MTDISSDPKIQNEPPLITRRSTMSSRSVSFAETTCFSTSTRSEENLCRNYLRITLLAVFCLASLTILFTYVNINSKLGQYLYQSKYSQIFSPLICGISLLCFILTWARCDKIPESQARDQYREQYRFPPSANSSPVIPKRQVKRNSIQLEKILAEESDE